MPTRVSPSASPPADRHTGTPPHRHTGTPAHRHTGAPGPREGGPGSSVPPDPGPPRGCGPQPAPDCMSAPRCLGQHFFGKISVASRPPTASGPRASGPCATTSRCRPPGLQQAGQAQGGYRHHRGGGPGRPGRGVHPLTTEPQARQAWPAAVPEVVRQARNRWSLTLEKPFQPRPGPGPRAGMAVRPVRPGISRLSRPGRRGQAARALTGTRVTRGWRPEEFWRVGPGKNGRVGQNETRPPPRMRWRGPCQAAPRRVGQLPGFPRTAGLPPVPATRQRPRFPGFFHVPEFPPSGARFRR